MNSEISEARSEEFAKEINVEDAEQEESEINRNYNNDCLDVIQPHEITVSNPAILQENSSNDDLTSPTDFESVSLGPSILEHGDYTSAHPIVIGSAHLQVGNQSEMHSRPIYLDVPSHQIQPMQPLLTHTYENLPPPPLYSELSLHNISHTTQGYPGPPPSFSPNIGVQWKWVGNGWSVVMPPEDTNWSSATPWQRSGTPIYRNVCGYRRRRTGEIFLWVVIIFLLAIIGFLTYKHLELLALFQGLQPYKSNEEKNVKLHKFTFSLTTNASPSGSPVTSQPVQIVEVENVPLHSYYIEYALFCLGVTAIALAVCRDVCRKK